ITPSARREPPPEREYTPRQINRPSTSNPPPGALTFKPGAELTVEQRLTRLEAYFAGSTEGRVFSLQDAFRAAQSTSREHQDAEEHYIPTAIRRLIERHGGGPRFFNDPPASINSTPQTPAGGNYATALNVINTLRATQRLPYGGEVEARAVVRATEQLRD